jgi:hypothetical protein
MKISNKKGGILNTMFMFIMLFLVWTFWLGSFLADWGEQAIADTGITGLEAFFYANLNLWFGLLFVASLFSAFYFGGNGA